MLRRRARERVQKGTGYAEPKWIKVEPWVCRAARVNKWDGQRQFHIQERPRSSRLNPDYHPEWFHSAQRFINLVNKHHGDFREIEQAVKTKLK